MEKTCPKCKQTKAISEFNRNKRRKDGYGSECRNCIRAYQNAHYHANHEVEIRKRMDRKAKIREDFNTFRKTLKCERCPEDHEAALDFHHLDPKQKDRSVSEGLLMGWSLRRIQDEIAKCIVLCSNCHRKLHWEERNGASGRD